MKGLQEDIKTSFSQPTPNSTQKVPTILRQERLPIIIAPWPKLVSSLGRERFQRCAILKLCPLAQHTPPLPRTHAERTLFVVARWRRHRNNILCIHNARIINTRILPHPFNSPSDWRHTSCASLYQNLPRLASRVLLSAIRKRCSRLTSYTATDSQTIPGYLGMKY